MKKSENYLNSVHRIGRIGTVGALGFMIGIPYLIATVYDIWPSLSNVLKVSSGLLALFIPIAVSEIISFMPIVGSASYINSASKSLISETSNTNSNNIYVTSIIWRYVRTYVT